MLALTIIKVILAFATFAINVGLWIYVFQWLGLAIALGLFFTAFSVELKLTELHKKKILAESPVAYLYAIEKAFDKYQPPPPEPIQPIRTNDGTTIRKIGVH